VEFGYKGLEQQKRRAADFDTVNQEGAIYVPCAAPATEGFGNKERIQYLL
jgi:hypothetical protein